MKPDGGWEDIEYNVVEPLERGVTVLATFPYLSYITRFTVYNYCTGRYSTSITLQGHVTVLSTGLKCQWVRPPE